MGKLKDFIKSKKPEYESKKEKYGKKARDILDKTDEELDALEAEILSIAGPRYYRIIESETIGALTRELFNKKRLVEEFEVDISLNDKKYDDVKEKIKENKIKEDKEKNKKK